MTTNTPVRTATSRHQRASRVRAAFTVVEVLVVTLIVAVFLLLFIPYLLRQREAARRARCEFNLQKIAEAALAYEGLQGSFPGYVEPVAGPREAPPRQASWVVPLLPFRDQEDLFNRWQRGQPEAARLPWLICPEDTAAKEDPEPATLSYVANCGLPGDDDTEAHGVFFNHAVRRTRVSRDEIERRDGAASTLLFSENLQAGLWTDTTEAGVGMVWHREPGPCAPINRCRGAARRPQDLEYARPSSNHARGVTAAFCDGHLAFLSDAIDYAIYRHLMTPDSRAAGLAAEAFPPVAARVCWRN